MANATFQVYVDRAGEWRWRLVHDNGNIIATSGQGYKRKESALEGIRSVKSNVPDAAVEEHQTRELDGSFD
jgi:hypothetical protein